MSPDHLLVGLTWSFELLPPVEWDAFAERPVTVPLALQENPPIGCPPVLPQRVAAVRAETARVGEGGDDDEEHCHDGLPGQNSTYVS